MNTSRFRLLPVMVVFACTLSCAHGKKERATMRDVQVLRSANAQLETRLRDEIARKEIELNQCRDAFTINIVDSLFFRSGDANIKVRGERALREIGTVLAGLPPDKLIRIEGHTDSVPIGRRIREKFPSNWELGAARAATVARFLVMDAGVDPGRVMVVSYSKYRPAAPNTTLENRARNRRIEIIITNRVHFRNEGAGEGDQERGGSAGSAGERRPVR